MTDQPADLVLRGGPVQTMDPARSWARALAVRGERIVAVGREREVDDLIGPSTRVIELDGRLVLPGFQDAHVHPIESGIDRMRVDLSDSRGLDRYLGVISEYARTHPDVEWITGSGWSMDDFSGRHPQPDRSRSDRPRSTGLPAEPRWAHGVGQQPGA